jgi:TatA/E family protein of Tat protein translocase
MAGLTPGHLLLILIIALVVIGPGKLPEVGAALGKSIREFQKAAGQGGDASQASAPAPQPMAPVYPAGGQPPAQSFYAAPPAYGAQPYAPQPGYPPPAYPAPYPPGPVDPAATGGQPGIAPAASDAAPPTEHPRVD